jgi:ABC-type lipoprotein export system ATPase subunit
MTASATERAMLATCDGVSVVYGDGPSRVVALDAVDLRIAPGERLALWGRSGSGKTTLLHVLGGLVTPTAGAVSWRGAPLSSLDAAARARLRARAIAYVFQGANLLPSFTAFENVAFALRAGGQRGAEADPAGLLGLVGLAAKLDALPSELSGGEAQRVAIARALGQQPELLLCDEPTGQLDSDTGARVLDLIAALQDELGFALVLATHDADVAALADRTVTLLDGRVVDEEESQR